MELSFIAAANQTRAEIVQELRRLVPERSPATGHVLSFGLPALDACLPGGGLSLAAVHEIVPETDTDKPAALGFIAALFGRLHRRGPIIFITSPANGGCLSGHGMNGLGLDPARVIMVRTADETQALWAMEETLRSCVPAAVAGTAGAKLDFLAGQRLSLAAGDAEIPLLLLRPPGLPGVNVAMTRWRVRSCPSRRDRFGLATHWRWQLRLERCRNGRTGDWLVEFDHAAYRFSLAAAMADSAFSRRAGTQSIAAIPHRP